MNNKKVFLFIGSLVLVSGVIYLIGGGFSDGNKIENSIGNGQRVVIYKSPDCGCCEVYAKYLRKNGFDVKISDERDMDGIKNKFGIPSNLESCHTVKMGDYIVEGHVPMDAISKLLTEKPDVLGISLPGMPSGSPGMPGLKDSQFKIYSFKNNGLINEFQSL